MEQQRDQRVEHHAEAEHEHRDQQVEHRHVHRRAVHSVLLGCQAASGIAVPFAELEAGKVAAVEHTVPDIAAVALLGNLLLLRMLLLLLLLRRQGAGTSPLSRESQSHFVRETENE